jgi:hypothetical protein
MLDVLPSAHSIKFQNTITFENEKLEIEKITRLQMLTGLLS